MILVGGHRSIDNMNDVLNEGKVEYLSLSCPLIREPDLVNRWQRGECSPEYIKYMDKQSYRVSIFYSGYRRAGSSGEFWYYQKRICRAAC